MNPDPKFGNIIITKFMNSIMYDGKKSAAESIVYGALAMIETKTKQGPLPVFEQALENVYRPSKCGRAASVAPPTRCRSGVRSAVRRWAFAGSSRRRAIRNEKTMTERLGRTARRVEQPGNAVKKREDVHRMAEANRPSRTIAGNGETRILRNSPCPAFMP